MLDHLFPMGSGRSFAVSDKPKRIPEPYFPPRFHQPQADALGRRDHCTLGIPIDYKVD